MSNKATSLELLLTKDRWHASEIGLKADIAHSAFYLNFGKIEVPWLATAAKQFVRYQAVTRSFNTCKAYISSLVHFSRFIMSSHPLLVPQQIQRSTIIDYLNYLSKSNLSAATKNMALVNLRTFFDVASFEKWLLIKDPRLVISNDVPKPNPPQPNFIPEYVLQQLLDNLDELSSQMACLVTILYETGRRIAEICALPYDCLYKDKNADAFLRVHDRKMKKHYLIPINDECQAAIEEQQQQQPKTAIYLFKPKKGKREYLSARGVNNALNALATKKNIKDELGNIWRFSSHQFRHTVGTRMINSGVPQAIVQRYLGHESPEMTSRYAYIHDQTLKREFLKFQDRLVDIRGKVSTIDSNTANDATWLRENIMAQSLPNGLCALPAPQQRCPHANACLTCSHFRTDTRYLSVHEKQLNQTNEAVCVAKKNGWQRQVEMNQEVAINLENIISQLKGSSNE